MLVLKIKKEVLSLTIGEKIKMLRKMRGITQNELSGSTLTRNMISQIERGSALPSVPTIKHIANKLGVDAGYFLCDDDNLVKYLLTAERDKIRECYKSKDYKKCLELCKDYEEYNDDELNLILCDCYSALAREYLSKGKLASAKKCFEKSEHFSNNSVYSSARNEANKFYIGVIDSILNENFTSLVSPLEYVDMYRDFIDLCLCVYIVNLITAGIPDKAAAVYDTIKIKNQLYREYINAKLSMANYNFQRAKQLLLSIIENADKNKVPMPLVYMSINDLEICNKALSDYQGAYECANMKIKYISHFHE